MPYYGYRSSRNTGITKWRQPSRNPELEPYAETYDQYKKILIGRLKDLGPCILPGGKGTPQIIIASKYTKLKTIKGEWPILRTGDISQYEEWTKKIIDEYPEYFAKQYVIYKRNLAIGSNNNYASKGGDIVYFVGAEGMPYVKIGTTNNIEKRLAGIQTSLPYELKLLFHIEGDRKAEKETHKRFEKYRKRGEWFELKEELASYVEYMLNTNNPYIEPWEWGTGI